MNFYALPHVNHRRFFPLYTKLQISFGLNNVKFHNRVLFYNNI